MDDLVSANPKLDELSAFVWKRESPMTRRVFMTLVRAPLLSVLSFAPAFTELCKADDAQDALELLGYALKCAIKPYLTYTGDSPTLIVNRSVGNAHQLAIETEVTSVSKDGSLDPHVIRVDANFSDLDKVDIHEGDNNSGADVYWAHPPTVEPHCSNDRRCITVAGSSLSNYSIEVCDAATAARAKLAIDTLIELNKSMPTNNTSVPNTSEPDDLFDHALDYSKVGKKTNNTSAPNTSDSDDLFGHVIDYSEVGRKKK
jgi:hypothetical protein